ncbi:MAG: septum formation protein Maf [Deltaproteobacteria bacterium]|jgi:septum formation protein|nr:septum formation protein Maf [Deltaproteobacteria bacterium]MBW2534656.1 septum formation protein Maf [Deltaproteobacteria bacterium]
MRDRPTIDGDRPLILGSASPRRRDILLRLGIPIRIHPVSVDEACRPSEAADEYLDRVVRAKLDALAREPDLDGAGMLVADTAVILDQAIFGKPDSDAHAAEMLRALSGRTHQVSTRFAIAAADAPSRCLVVQTVRTQVHFRELDDEHVARYVATGEGRDKAGAYAVQGLGAFAVERIEGSFTNVVGLPACEVVAALERAGLLAGFPLPGATAPPTVY